MLHYMKILYLAGDGTVTYAYRTWCVLVVTPIFCFSIFILRIRWKGVSSWDDMHLNMLRNVHLSVEGYACIQIENKHQNGET